MYGTNNDGKMSSSVLKIKKKYLRKTIIEIIIISEDVILGMFL